MNMRKMHYLLNVIQDKLILTVERSSASHLVHSLIEIQKICTAASFVSKRSVVLEDKGAHFVPCKRKQLR